MAAKYSKIHDRDYNSSNIPKGAFNLDDIPRENNTVLIIDPENGYMVTSRLAHIKAKDSFLYIDGEKGTLYFARDDAYYDRDNGTVVVNAYKSNTKPVILGTNPTDSPLSDKDRYTYTVPDKFKRINEEDTIIYYRYIYAEQWWKQIAIGDIVQYDLIMELDKSAGESKHYMAMDAPRYDRVTGGVVVTSYDYSTSEELTENYIDGDDA